MCIAEGVVASRRSTRSAAIDFGVPVSIASRPRPSERTSANHPPTRLNRDSYQTDMSRLGLDLRVGKLPTNFPSDPLLQHPSQRTRTVLFVPPVVGEPFRKARVETVFSGEWTNITLTIVLTHTRSGSRSGLGSRSRPCPTTLTPAHHPHAPPRPSYQSNRPLALRSPPPIPIANQQIEPSPHH